MTRSPIPNARLDALTRSDFGIIAELGATIWRSHYASIISTAQIEYMLAGRYTPEKLQAYLKACDRWLMLLRLYDKPIGYCSYALTTEASEIKLEQLYLSAEYRHMGLGRMMLQHIEDQARVHGATRLVLQVNRFNTVAIDFYRKAGFRIRQAAVFDIGCGFIMDDYVMEKPLRAGRIARSDD